jgi:hypothetical protein
MHRYIGYDGLLGYEGLDIKGLEGYVGLDILNSRASSRPVQIMRQFKPHSETNHYAPKSAYHRYKGLSIAPEKPGNQEGYPISLLV